MDLIADTTFLIGLWRNQSWATRFAKEHHSKVLGIPWVVLGEFWHGAQRARHDASEVERFLSLGLPLLETVDVIPHYAETCAKLQENAPGEYQRMGQNDLWIAASALAWDRPLVTRNERHFRAIIGLELVALKG